MKKSIFTLGVLSLFFAGNTIVNAQELEELSLQDLLDIEVVTASRSGKQRSGTAPATIVVITEDKIKSRAYTSLLEVLMDLPDFKIEMNNDPRWQHDIQLRGVFGMDKFVILLDGVRISSPTNDIIPVMENFSPHIAKQIEVVYGPASALYGADALSGVINIISKNADNLTSGIGFTNAHLQGGMYNSVTGNIQIGKKVSDDISYSLGGQFYYDKQPPLHEYYPDSADYGNILQYLRTGIFPTDFGFPQQPNAPVRPQVTNPLSAYMLHGRLKIGDFTLSAFHNGSKNPASTANRPNNTIYNDDAFFGHHITQINGQYSTQFTEDITGNSFLVYSRYDLDSRSNFRNMYTGMEPAYLFSYGEMIKAEQLVTWNVTPELILTGGATYESYKSVPRGHDLQNPVTDNNNLREVIVGSVGLPGAPNGIPARFFELTYNNLGALLQAQYAPTDELTITAGARIDNDSRIEELIFNPRLGIVYRTEDKFTVKALYGSAFLAPSPLAAYDEYGTFFPDQNGQTRSAFFRLSNPNLGPQKIQTFEVGISSYIGNNLQLSVNGYYNMLSGLFAQVPAVLRGLYPGNDATPSPVDGFYPGTDFPVDFIESIVNQGSQTNYGGTVQIDYLYSYSDKLRINTYLALSVVDGTVNPEDNDLNTPDEVEIGGISPLMIRWGADISIGDFRVSPRLIWASDQRTHPQYALSVKADDPSKRQTVPGYTLLNITASYYLGSGVTIFTEVNNALDQRFRSISLQTAPDGLPAGFSTSEFLRGAPQNPIRAFVGLQISL